MSMVTNEQGFGTLVPWAAAAAHQLGTIGLPRAFLAVSSQKLLYSMMRRIVEVVLATLARTDATNVQYKQLADRQLHAADDLEGKLALGTQAQGPAPIFDVLCILNSCRDRLEEAEDALWLLRTDPWQLRAASGAARNSKTSKMVSVKHSHRHVIYSVSMLPVQEWELVQEPENVVRIYKKFGTDIELGKPLPNDYSEALACLQVMLSDMLAARSQDLADSMPRLKAFEHHLSIEEDIVNGTGVMSSVPTDDDFESVWAQDPRIRSLPISQHWHQRN